MWIKEKIQSISNYQNSENSMFIVVHLSAKNINPYKTKDRVNYTRKFVFHLGIGPDDVVLSGDSLDPEFPPSASMSMIRRKCHSLDDQQFDRSLV